MHDPAIGRAHGFHDDRATCPLYLLHRMVREPTNHFNAAHAVGIHVSDDTHCVSRHGPQAPAENVLERQERAPPFADEKTALGDDNLNPKVRRVLAPVISAMNLTLKPHRVKECSRHLNHAGRELVPLHGGF